MAIGTLANAVTPWGAAAATATSASFTPAAGDLLICFAAARPSAAAIPTVSDSLSGTWTPFDAGIDIGATASRLFWKVANGSAQTVTVASTGATQVGGVISKCSGAGTDFSNYQTNSGASAPRAVTMAAFTAGSACAYFLVASAGTTWTAPTGYAEVYDGFVSTNLRMVWGFDQTADTVAISTTGTGIDSALYAVEIKLPAAAGGSVEKVWTGSAWAAKPVKVWDGSAWVAKPLKIWNGSAWV